MTTPFTSLYHSDYKGSHVVGSLGNGYRQGDESFGRERDEWTVGTDESGQDHSEAQKGRLRGDGSS